MMLIKSKCCRPFGLWTTIKHPRRRNAGARARLTGSCANHLHMSLHQYLQCQFFFPDHWYLPFPRHNSTAFLFVLCLFTSRAGARYSSVTADLRLASVQLPPPQAVRSMRLHCSLHRCECASHLFSCHVLSGHTEFFGLNVIAPSGTKSNFCSIKCKSVQEETRFGTR